MSNVTFSKYPEVPNKSITIFYVSTAGLSKNFLIRNSGVNEKVYLDLWWMSISLHTITYLHTSSQLWYIKTSLQNMLNIMDETK